ncbi:Hypothetical predicted protein [Scomber scombrus]|uniref:Uncharacterized protein n=1 Tax=Scomber scombrus TaxID=13677 RepID=A0AAV1NX80_SCOSC
MKTESKRKPVTMNEAEKSERGKEELRGGQQQQRTRRKMQSGSSTAQKNTHLNSSIINPVVRFYIYSCQSASSSQGECRPTNARTCGQFPLLSHFISHARLRSVGGKRKHLEGGGGSKKKKA